MKVYLSNNRFYMDDNGTIVELFPDKNNYLKLPANSCERTYVSVQKVLKSDGQCVDYGTSIKDHRVLGPKSTTPKTPTKGIEEYLNGDDKELYLSLVKKAMRNREKMMLKAQIERLEKELQEMGE